jgi:hypothetical protein
MDATSARFSVQTLHNAAGAVNGMVVKDRGTGQEATVLFGPAGLWTAGVAESLNAPAGLQFRGFDTSGTGGTPTLRAGSAVRILLPPESDAPVVEFDLEFEAFQAQPWQRALGATLPLHFLVTHLPNATYHYQGGGLIPSARVDPFPLSRVGAMAGDWAPNWTYAPALEGWAVPAVGLWRHRTGEMLAYDFQAARQTDRSSQRVAVASAEPEDRPPFICLVHPPQREWTQLTYPEASGRVASRFDLVMRQDVDLDTSPNQVILSRLATRYRDLLPPVPRMNNLDWIDTADGWTSPVGLSRTLCGTTLINRTGTTGFDSIFHEPGTLWMDNAFMADALAHAYATGNTPSIDRLRRDLDWLLDRAQRFTVDGDPCVAWDHPLEPGFREQFGGAAATGIQHCKNWHTATAFLLMYEHERDERYLPIVEGCYNWVRHTVYTRNGVCDLPWAMFSRLGTAAGENFLLSYHRVFRDSEDPDQRRRALDAIAMARTCLYKVLWFYTADPNLEDGMDPAFLNQAVNDKNWIGRVTWNEASWPLRTMIPLYCETGDPLFRYLIRGALERYWKGFRGDGGVAENIQILGEIEPVGLRTGGFADGQFSLVFRRYALPPRGADLRVVCGPAAGMAFGRGTQAFDISDYAWRENGAFRFRVVAIAPDDRGEGAGPLEVVVSAPFRSLRDKSVRVDGHTVDVEVNPATEGEDILVSQVQPGTVIEVGDWQAAAPECQVEHDPGWDALWRRPDRNGAAADPMQGFVCLELGTAANRELVTAWRGDETWFGLVPGRHWRHGVPFEIAAPEHHSGRVAVSDHARITIPEDLRRNAVRAFLFLGLRRAESPSDREAAEDREIARLQVLGPGGQSERIAVYPQDCLSADITAGLPLREWDLVLFPVDLDDAEQIQVERGTVLAMTLATSDCPPERLAVCAEHLALSRRLAERERLRRERLRTGTFLRLIVQYTASHVHQYLYATFYRSRAPVTIPADSYLEYDMYIPSTSAGASGGIDLIGGTLDSLRDEMLADDRGHSHPSNAVAVMPQDRDTWIHRRIDLESVAGKTFEIAVAAVEGWEHVAGRGEVRFKDVMLTGPDGGCRVPLFVNLDQLAEGLPEAELRLDIEDWSLDVVGVAEQAAARDPAGSGRSALPPPAGNQLPDPSFEEPRENWRLWPQGGAWVQTDPHSGDRCLDLSVAEGGLACVQTSPLASLKLDLEPETEYEVTFHARSTTTGGASVFVNFFDFGGYDFPQAEVPIAVDGSWHRYQVRVRTGAFPRLPAASGVFATLPPALPALRLWTSGTPQTVLVDDVSVVRVTTPR